MAVRVGLGLNKVAPTLTSTPTASNSCTRRIQIASQNHLNTKVRQKYSFWSHIIKIRAIALLTGTSDQSSLHFVGLRKMIDLNQWPRDPANQYAASRLRHRNSIHNKVAQSEQTEFAIFSTLCKSFTREKSRFLTRTLSVVSFAVVT